MKSLKSLSKQQLETMYLKMEEVRQFESKAVELYQANELPGFLHSCLGQEACAIGFVSALADDDYIVTTHRGHGHAITRGTSMNHMMAELYAKKDGCCRGKGGSMHMLDRSKNILGAQGIVGQGTTIATGAALAIQMQGSKQVSVCFFGDGAQNEGFFHESMNLASIWNLPVIFACENNLYAESTSQKYHMKPDDIAQRAAAYNVTSFIADGNDVMDVYNKASEAIELCRNGKGPVLFEMKTYRWLGHYVGDPGIYRPDEEVGLWKSDEKEPLSRFKRRLLDEKLFSEDELKSMEMVAAKNVEAAVEFARNSEALPPESALEDIYEGNMYY